MKKNLPKSLDKEDKGPKTDFDRKFLEAVDRAKKISGIKSDRAMSIELGRHTDFINRVRNGFQSTPAEAWDALLNRYPEASTINQSQVTGIAVGINHGIAAHTYTTLADCEKDLRSCQAQLIEASTKLAQTEQERAAFARELDVLRELVKAKDETIMLLKGGYNRPN